VCKREIEIQRNEKGIERIQRCTITHGCRGKLYQTKVLPDYVRGSIPPDIVGLDNWQQRRVLYDHEQTIERTSWTITHNLGTLPTVFVYVKRPTLDDPNHLEEITPQDIIVNDVNTITVVFDRAWSGVAQLVARQSDPHLLQPIVVTETTIVPPLQVSNNGEITIATRSATNYVGIELTYSTTQGDTKILSYAVDNQPSINSAWSDYDKVVVKGKVYTVRSFDGVTADMTSGDISTGSTFTFSHLNPTDGGSTGYRDIQPSEVILLLSSSPHETVDKITTRFVDVAVVTDPFALYYDSGEFYVVDSAVQSVYPPIRTT